MLDAHQLNIFLTAAETLNFTKAAERLHMSQPSISQHIRALEKHFDEVLFIRQGRSLILSDAGRILIPMAQQFVKQSTRINEAISSLKGHFKGEINIRCTALTGSYLLPKLFYQFHKLFSDVTISCTTNSCDSPLETLRSGDTHFLFTNLENIFEPCFETQQILTDEISLITHKNHPWAKRDFIEVEELLEEKFILPARTTKTYTKVNEALASTNISLLQLDSFLTLDNTESIVLSVNQGLGVGFSSTTIASAISDTVAVPLKDIKIELGLYIAKDKTQVSTAARAAFWDFITSATYGSED